MNPSLSESSGGLSGQCHSVTPLPHCLGVVDAGVSSTEHNLRSIEGRGVGTRDV